MILEARDAGYVALCGWGVSIAAQSLIKEFLVLLQNMENKEFLKEFLKELLFICIYLIID